MVLWYFPSHFVFCGQQSSWETWLSFSVKLFLTIVWRKPWKSESRTHKSIRKIGGREETLQLFFKQSFMAFKALLWFLQGTELEFFFKSLCLEVLKIICWDLFKHILGIQSCNNQWATLFGLSWSPVRTSPFKKQQQFCISCKNTAIILTVLECVCRVLLNISAPITQIQAILEVIFSYVKNVTLIKWPVCWDLSALK